MLKSLFTPLIISLLSLFSFFSSEVSLNINLPESASAGSEFLVEVTINKGNVEGFARFQQELPVGFTAVEKQSANGKFSFDNQTLKIQWMRIPYDQEVTVSYAIQVAPTISGNFDFGGKFSYIINNGVQVAKLTPKSVNIIADESAAALANATTYSYQNVSIKNIDCIRQKPYLNDNNEVIVNLLVNKSDLNGFGKIQEQVPKGYVAKSIRGKNSIFTFKNHTIKFMWMNMPPEKQFVVAYKLVPEGEIPDQAFLINGTFSYAENESRSKTINIAERNVDLKKFSDDELVAQKSEKPESTKPTPTNVTTTSTDTDVVPEKQKKQEYIAQKPETKQEYIPQKPETNTQVTQKQETGNLSAVVDIPKPEYGVAYRVQIAAGHRLVGKRYFKQLNITDHVQTEIHNGWHKYTVGNFSMYKDARDYRIYIWNNTPIHDAFVTAYNNGMRITVQEALMIANQKWYK